MKNILLIFSILLFNNLYGQKVDTLDYLKKIEYNKAKYIGKPFSVLLKDLKDLPPQTIWGSPHGKYKNIINRHYIGFHKGEFRLNDVIVMFISWEDSLSRDKVRYYEQKNKSYFTEEEKDFYSNKTIKNIQIFQY